MESREESHARIGLGRNVFEMVVSDPIFESKIRQGQDLLTSQLLELNVEIRFVFASGKIVRVDVWGIEKAEAEAVYDQLVQVQDSLINLSHEEEIEMEKEKERIRSKFSKRKTTAYNRLMELLGEGKEEGRQERQDKKTES